MDIPYVARANRLYHSVRLRVALVSLFFSNAFPQSIVAEQPSQQLTLLLIGNTTQDPIHFEIWERHKGEVKANARTLTLQPNKYYIFRTDWEHVVRYGESNTEAVLRPHRLYEFRTDAEVGQQVLIGYELSDPRPVLGETPQAHPFEGLQRDREKVRLLEQELRRVRDEIARPLELTSSLRDVQLGRVRVENGRATVNLTLPLIANVAQDVSLKIDARLYLGSCTVTVQPREMVLRDADHTVPLRIELDGVPCSGDVQGELVVSARWQQRQTTLSLPLYGTIDSDAATVARAVLNGHPIEKQPSLVVMSWPPGAEVFLTRLSQAWLGSVAPENRDLRRSRVLCARTSVGTAPVAMRLPAGTYRVELYPPTGISKPMAVPFNERSGGWASPEAEAVPITSENGVFAEVCTSVVDICDGAPRIVRAVWLAAAGTAAERFRGVTAGVDDLFDDLPRYDEFETFQAKVLARCGVPIQPDETKALFAALCKTGFVRHEVSGGAAVLDITYQPGRADPFVATIRRLHGNSRPVPVPSAASKP